MTETVITVENISKKYFIYSQGGKPDFSLKSLFTEKVNSIYKNIVHFRHADSSNELKEEFWALKEVSFTAKRGEIIGIIGRNGAGKSTLLKILARITEPTTGRIHIKGRVGSLLEVGTGFHPELTGRENIFLNGAILGMSKDEIHRKFDEIVAFAGIDRFLNTPVKRYSSGMYIRLAFSVAAHLEPEILIIDEVLAVGDQAFQNKCLGKMDEVVRQGRTILFVSHNMGAIRQLCSSGLWIENGAIKESGHSDMVVQKYLATLKKNNTMINFPIQSSLKNQITMLRLLDENSCECIDFPIGSEPILELHYVINDPMRGIHVACILNSSEGYHIFSTADTDLNPSLLEKVRGPGHYAAKLRLPVKDFNSGDYHIAVGIGIPNLEIHDRQNGPSFTIFDAGSFATMKEKKGRTGLLLAKVQWQYQKWANSIISN